MRLDEWLTVDDVARALRVSKMTIYRLTESGDIPSIRVGRSIRIKAEDAEFWVASGGTVPGAGA